jgi:ribonuclease VapC
VSGPEPLLAQGSVLDSSAVLAFLRREPGADLVEDRLATAAISAANWSETAQKLRQHGADVDRATRRLVALGVRVEPLTAQDALVAAGFWPDTRKHGLSLGDRCCLALTQRLGMPALTADVAWGQLSLTVTVQLIR